MAFTVTCRLKCLHVCKLELRTPALLTTLFYLLLHKVILHTQTFPSSYLLSTPFRQTLHLLNSTLPFHLTPRTWPIGAIYQQDIGKNNFSISSLSTDWNCTFAPSRVVCPSLRCPRFSFLLEVCTHSTLCWWPWCVFLAQQLLNLDFIFTSPTSVLWFYSTRHLRFCVALTLRSRIQIRWQTLTPLQMNFAIVVQVIKVTTRITSQH